MTATRPSALSRRARASAVGLLVLGCAIGGIVTVSAAGNEPQRPASRAAGDAPRLRPSVAAPGATVRAKGRLDTHVVRRVVLQRKAPTGWRRVAAGKSDGTGRYKIVFSAPLATVRLRVKAPAFERDEREYRKLVTAAARLQVSPSPTPTPTPTPSPTPTPTPAPTAVLEVPTVAIGAGPRPDAVVRTSGAPAGASVVLERQDGSAWHPVASAPVPADGVARLPLPLGDLGTGPATLRAVVPGFGPTTPATVDVRAPGKILEPIDDATLDGPFEVAVEVDPSLVATRVRLFLDGHVLPDAQPGRPGSWTSTVDPSSVPVNRLHVDVVARVVTAHGSGLTEPVRVELLPSLGLPPGFRIDTVVAGFDLPTSFAPIDEHRALVVEKGGLVRLAVDGTARATPVLDLRDVVADTGDGGILDVALDPDFGANGWFYLAYVFDGGAGGPFRTQRVVRYTLVGENASPASVHVVLGDVPLATCTADATSPGCLLNRDGAHTVDDLLFASDGSLLVSVGDGAPGDPGRAVAAQRLDVLAGKVLRIDPDTGLGLSDNPYYEPATPDANRGRVWAYGFRNPFRMAVSPAGDLYVGDVGEVGWEEVDRVVAGGNYGWPCFEGEDGDGTAPAGAADCEAVRSGTVVHRTPLVAYPHADFAGSVTLGAFAPAGSYPAAYDGLLFLGDYTSGRVWTLDVDDPGLEEFGTPPGLGAGVAYAVGPDGLVWYADIATGSIRRIVYDAGGDACLDGQFLAETFRNRLFEPETDGDPWVSSCVGAPPAGPDLVAPGSPNQGDGWSMRWTGSPQLAPGTYRLTAKSSGTLTVTVNGVQVPDGGTFTVAGSDVNEATADVVVRLANNPDFDDEPFFVDFDWGYRLAWERVGSAPDVTLSGVSQGEHVPVGSTITWSVAATDSEGDAVGVEQVRVTVTLLHYGTGSPHRHPAGSFAGATGSATLDDSHGPGKIAYRVVGVGTDDSGWVAESDPVYVCLVGNEVGPCG